MFLPFNENNINRNSIISIQYKNVNFLKLSFELQLICNSWSIKILTGNNEWAENQSTG